MAVAQEAFKISTVDGVPVLTLLVSSFTARNSHWIKEELAYYIREQQPKGLIVNLNNVTSVGHVGLGTLIALNNLLRGLHPHAFVCLGPEVQKVLHAANLDKTFPIWSLDQDCLICRKAQCAHKSELQKKFSEFLARDYPIDENKLPHLNEKVEHSKPVKKKAKTVELDLDEDDDAPVAVSRRRANWIGIAAVGIVFLGMAGTAIWVAFDKYARSGYTKVVPVNTEVIVTEYDMDGDGFLTVTDVPKMTETQRTNLTFTKYCSELNLPCKSPK